MGVVLVDLQRAEHAEKCNWWNWRPTLELLRLTGLFNDERLEVMGYNASAEVTEPEARAIARFLEDEVLTNLKPSERIQLDGTTTDVPDGGTFYREPEENYKNYSASEEWLHRFALFCTECGGFRVD